MRTFYAERRWPPLVESVARELGGVLEVPAAACGIAPGGPRASGAIDDRPLLRAGALRLTVVLTPTRSACGPGERHVMLGYAPFTAREIGRATKNLARAWERTPKSGGEGDGDDEDDLGDERALRFVRGRRRNPPWRCSRFELPSSSVSNSSLPRRYWLCVFRARAKRADRDSSSRQGYRLGRRQAGRNRQARWARISLGKSASTATAGRTSSPPSACTRRSASRAARRRRPKARETTFGR